MSPSLNDRQHNAKRHLHGTARRSLPAGDGVSLTLEVENDFEQVLNCCDRRGTCQLRLGAKLMIIDCHSEPSIAIAPIRDLIE